MQFKFNQCSFSLHTTCFRSHSSQPLRMECVKSQCWSVLGDQLWRLCLNPKKSKGGRYQRIRDCGKAYGGGGGLWGKTGPGFWQALWVRKNIFAEVPRGGGQVWVGQHGWDEYMHHSCSRGKRARQWDRQCLWKKLDWLLWSSRKRWVRKYTTVIVWGG